MKYEDLQKLNIKHKIAPVETTTPDDIQTYKQNCLKLTNWPAESGDYVEIEYIRVIDKLNGKELLHMPINDLAKEYLLLKAKYKKSQAMFAQVNKYRKQYKTRLESYER